MSLWTAVVACSLGWSLHAQGVHVLEMAKQSAEVTFENDVAYRRWVARQGGVYAPISRDLQPNPYLRVADRDVTTTSGLRLTLVNPAYMARLVSEMSGGRAGGKGHLTSLDPVRPENAPDAWEATALRSLQDGASEYSTVEPDVAGETVRIMRPFVVEQSCLRCHAGKGHKDGDIRGGISVSVPTGPIKALVRTAELRLTVVHVVLLLAGLTGIVFARSRLSGQMKAREESERLAREGELSLRQTLESIPGLVFTTGRDGKCDYLSRQWSEFTGIPMAELGGDGWLGTVHPDDRERVVVAWREAIEGRSDYDLEHRLRRRDGSYEWFKVRGRPIRDASGQLVRWFGVATGIDAIKRAEQGLTWTSRRDEVLSATAGRLLAIDDPRQIVDDLGRKIMELLDCQVFLNFMVDEPAGTLRLNACGGVAPEVASKVERVDRDTTVSGSVACHGQRVVAEDIPSSDDPRLGLTRELGLTAYCCDPLKAGDRIIGTLSFGTRTRARFSADELAVMRSVADLVAISMARALSAEELRRAAEETRLSREELRRVNEQLDQKVRDRTEQLANQAAQLRALAGELTLAEQRERRRMARILHDHLQQLLVGAKYRVAILGRTADETIRKSSVEIEMLLGESIQASRSLTAELSPPILVDAGLAAGLRWLVRWMADKHDLRMELSVEDEVPGQPEDMKVLLFESVRELLFNVVKHAHVPVATVTVHVEGGNQVITVCDAGPGFEPNSLKPAGSAGGGFGLFSIRERLTLMGGRLEIDSAAGKGSRVRLVAPVCAPITLAPEPEPEPAVPTNGSAGAKSASGPGPRLRVLLVDDHVVMRQGLAQLLGSEQDLQIVGEAADGQEAVEMVARLLPDVVLMDVSLPRLSGIEATRVIASGFPGVQVIGLSMFEEAERAQAMRDAGARAYLSKSGPADVLIATIRSCQRA